MPDIIPQVQEMIDAVVKCLDKLPFKEKRSAIKQLQNLLTQKYDNSSNDGSAQMSMDGTSNSVYKVKKSTKKRLSPKKTVLEDESSKRVHCELGLPFGDTKADDELQSIHSENLVDVKISEAPQFVNVVVVDLKTNSNVPKIELMKSSQTTRIKKTKQEMKGYFIKYPTIDTNATELLSVDKCLELVPKITKEVNVHIHCQESPKKQNEKKQFNTKIRKCSLCNFVTSQTLIFSNHMKEHNEKQFTCATCGKAFHLASGLKAHEKRHSGIQDFQCDSCSFKSYTKADMSRHMNQHTGTRQFVCQYCGKLFSLESTLRIHLRTIHERDKKYPCDQCDFSSYHKPNLRLHIQVHHTDGSSVYKMTCPICHIRIQQKSTYIDHMRSHTGERPYSCESCGREFACLSRLNAHVKTVHAPRLFPCSECSKTFQSTHHLQRHSLIHTKEKPYKCPKCKHASNTQGNLKKHMKNTHRIMDFSCRKTKQIVAEVDPVTLEKSIKQGQIITEEYLAELSAKSGKTVTLEELKKREEEKLNNPKPKIMSKKEQQKNEKRTKFEHSYHLVELLTNSTEGSLDMPVLDMNPATEAKYLSMEETEVSALSAAQTMQAVCLDECDQDNSSETNTPCTITWFRDGTSKNICQDFTDNSNCAEQSILYGEIAEELYIDDAGSENIENMEDQYTLYEVNDSSGSLCQSDYTISLNTPETELRTAEDIILMINDGNILIIGESQE